jgi:hypothetical protein
VHESGADFIKGLFNIGYNKAIAYLEQFENLGVTDPH